MSVSTSTSGSHSWCYANASDSSHKQPSVIGPTTTATVGTAYTRSLIRRLTKSTGIVLSPSDMTVLQTLSSAVASPVSISTTSGNNLVPVPVQGSCWITLDFPSGRTDASDIRGQHIRHMLSRWIVSNYQVEEHTLPHGGFQLSIDASWLSTQQRSNLFLLDEPLWPESRCGLSHSEIESLVFSNLTDYDRYPQLVYAEEWTPALVELVMTEIAIEYLHDWVHHWEMTLDEVIASTVGDFILGLYRLPVAGAKLACFYTVLRSVAAAAIARAT